MTKYVSLEHTRASIQDSIVRLKPGDILDDTIHPVAALQESGVALLALTTQGRIDVVEKYNRRSVVKGDPEGSLLASMLRQGAFAPACVLAATVAGDGSSLIFGNVFNVDELSSQQLGVGEYQLFPVDGATGFFPSWIVATPASDYAGVMSVVVTNYTGSSILVQVYDADGAPFNGQVNVLAFGM